MLMVDASDRPRKVLVLAVFDGTNANVIRDFLFSFNAYSRHRYYYVFDCRILEEKFDLSPFDVILIFWSVYLPGPDLSEGAKEKIRKADCLKVLFLQDEYRDVRRMNKIMSHLGIQVMFTCVAEEDHETFYPHSLIPTLEATYTVLPGYVPAYLEHAHVDAAGPRPLDIGYRSRSVPYYLGDLGQEKTIVAKRFKTISVEHGFRSDISVAERDRIYGKRWVDFLRSSRCVLGSASGASVVDFTGEIRRNCELYLGLNPATPYEEIKQKFFGDVDWKVVIDTISPRVFEAAALRCTLVQHEGRYGGVLTPDEHYICVRRDYSNIDDVIDRMKDLAFCHQIAENAYRDLIRTGLYGYRAFAQRFDKVLTNHIRKPVQSRSVSVLAFYTRNYVRHAQAIIPYRNRFFIMPSKKLAHALVRRALLPLKRIAWGPVMPRFIENPGSFLFMSYWSWRIALTVRPLRKILLCYFCHREVQRQVSLSELIRDLVRLDILRQARAGNLTTDRPFHVSVGFSPESGILKFTSRSINEAGENGLPPALPGALQDGRVKVIIWDHSGLGLGIVYDKSPTVGLGSGGVHRFQALTQVARRLPEKMCPILLRIFRGEVFPKQRPLRRIS